MTTKLDKPIKREIEVDGTAYTVTIDAKGVTMAPKRARTGVVVTWRELYEKNGASRG